MAETLADRIMAAADNYAGERWAVGAGLTMADDRMGAYRATLAALVAEATAERVCRWTYQGAGGGWYKQECTGDEYSYVPGVFCPKCGGRIELVADGQEVTDG